jgi:hypothetical protein
MVIGTNGCKKNKNMMASLKEKKYKNHKVDVDETFFKCRGLTNFQP